ncbi:MAG: serine/threonine-protein kinase [Planctomycetota bacterium]
MQLPRPFGPFRLTERLGAGATASVYCAERAGTRYALKLPKLEVELAPPRLERLRREVELAGRLEHPQLAACLEAGRIEERLYLLLPLVEGGQHLDRAWATTPLLTRLEHLQQVAEAVGHAHARGVVHRDLKPQNVLVGADGRAYVTDLGAAALSEAQPGLALTRSGDVVGTPSYAPPEHLRGGSRDAAPTADVWALGILLHLALCDRHPFAGENLLELLERAEAGIFLPPGTPAALAELCAQALALDPAQRPSDGAAFARALVAAQAELEPTTERFADYTLGAELGRGCSGVVYRAREPRLNRDVALKVLHLRTDQDRERFLREAEAMARVQHPNLVRVHASGLEGERAFLAMELIEGEPLPERQVAPRRAAEVTQQLARALEALHAAGVVHRDVKPQNTLCARDGRVCLSDLGLARLSESSRLTATRAFVGTPAYAALEQFHSSRVTPAADVYALGAISMLLTGRPPRRGVQLLRRAHGWRAALPRPPSELGGDPALDAVCLAAL